jgi:hypothetical protein
VSCHSESTYASSVMNTKKTVFLSGISSAETHLHDHDGQAEPRVKKGRRNTAPGSYTVHNTRVYIQYTRLSGEQTYPSHASATVPKAHVSVSIRSLGTVRPVEAGTENEAR